MKLPATQRARAGIVVAAVLVGAGTVTGIAVGRDGGETAAAADGSIRLEVDMTSCGGQWTAPVRGGAVSLALANAYSQPLDVYLQDPTDAKMYAEVEGLGTGATAPIDVVLGDGTYRLVCTSDGTPAAPGPAVTIAHAGKLADATPGLVPVTRNEIAPAAQKYQAWVRTRLALLQEQVQRLQQAAAAGDRARTERAWLTAHLTYGTVGAAYELFGDTGEAIDGLPASGRTALDDPDLTGFHKIEALLWSGAPLTRVQGLIAGLAKDVSTLSVSLLSDPIDENDIALRAHEIVENAIQFQLNGTDDGGSHTSLATLSANLVGAEKALSVLTEVLQPRYDRLKETHEALAAARVLVDGYDHGNHWTPVQDLGQHERETLTTTIGATVELLAPVAAICDLRNEVPVDEKSATNGSEEDK